MDFDPAQTPPPPHQSGKFHYFILNPSPSKKTKQYLVFSVKLQSKQNLCARQFETLKSRSSVILFREKNFESEKNCRSEKNLGPKNFFGPQILFAQKICVQNNFGPKQIFCPKKILGTETILGPKKFCI